jgi:hemolysin D
MSAVKVALAATKNVIAFPRVRGREREELAFLPAALEIVETPPSPIGRSIGATIIALFCIALVWAIFGHVDIVASATGKVVPSGRVKLIQPFETGVVRAIEVREGQSVKAGDVLIELDSTIVAAEQEHIRSDLIAAQLDAARLRAALSDSDNPEDAFRPPMEASPDLAAMQKSFLNRQVEEYRAKIASIDQQRVQKEAERDTVSATISKLEATAPIIQQRLDIYKTLSDRQLGSRLTYLESLQAMTENEKEREIDKSRLDEANAALAAITNTKGQEVAEFHRVLFGELSEAERKAAGFSRDLLKAEQRMKLERLTAPVDGVVQQLSIHTVGGVVTPAQQLAVVVPSEGVLEVEAMISNRDVGFIHAGQDAQIKVDAFNFTLYGLLHGRVTSVSKDAIVRDLPQEKPKGDVNESASTSEPKGSEFNYAARVSLDQPNIQIGDSMANLLPGMAVTVEFKTGSRRIISYLLSPVLKYTHDALRER